MYSYVGAAGNFLASIDSMSENAFKTVIEIDTVSISEDCNKSAEVDQFFYCSSERSIPSKPHFHTSGLLKVRISMSVHCYTTKVCAYLSVIFHVMELLSPSARYTVSSTCIRRQGSSRCSLASNRSRRGAYGSALECHCARANR